MRYRPCGLRAQTKAAVEQTLRQDQKTLVFGLDSLPVLDDAAVSAFILAQRKMRDAGGSVRLVTQRPAHRQYLALTGLNRVFDVAARAEEL